MSAGRTGVAAGAPVPLHLVGASPVDVPLTGRQPQDRPPLARLCAGEPLLLDEDEIDLIAMLNSVHEVFDELLPNVDPDEFRLAEVLLEFFCHRYGIQRHADGDRIKSVVSIYLRHLLPFLVELDQSRAAQVRGVAHLRINHLEALPQVLAGDRPLPAATVAGDLLGRRATTCIFLSFHDAAIVTTGGAAALEQALASGTVVPVADIRSGEPLLRAADLRDAGILSERDWPHGLSKTTAGNVLRDLTQAVDRARDHGAQVRGTFRLHAIEPLQDRRLRSPKPAREYVSLESIMVTNAQMRIIGQVVLWVARLVGERISEVYGLRVSDYWRDDHGRGWLQIDKQGGKSSMVRDPDTGKLNRQDGKDGTKTPAGTRTVPIPAALATLLETFIDLFHTDPVTGQVEPGARLIPGIQAEDVSGQSSFRTWLKEAQALTGAPFDPHDLRGALVTDLKDAGIDARVAHYYAGHELPNSTIQDVHYDRGPAAGLLIEVAEVLEAKIGAELGTDDLRTPTVLKECWGRDTRHHRQNDAIERRLTDNGWRAPRQNEPNAGRLMSVREVAAATGQSAPHTRRQMSSGLIPAHQRPWGGREVWVAWQADVERYQTATARTTIHELAADIGWNYNQTWQLLRSLALVDETRARGATIRLSGESVATAHAAVRRREDLASVAVNVRDAATALDLAVSTVETLIRQGHLEVAPATEEGRTRWVTRASVTAYNTAHPPTLGTPAGTPAAAGVLLTMAETRRLLELTRPALTREIAARQLRTASKPGSRHLYVTCSSALVWARLRGLAAVEARLLARASQE